MATVTKQTIIDGSRNLVVKVHITGATDLAATVLVDASTYSPAFTDARLMKVEGNLAGIKLDLAWDADTDVPIISLGDGSFCHDFKDHGGIRNNAGTGKTGDIVGTSESASADTYGWITFYLKKTV
jgi:hypothetical protein